MSTKKSKIKTTSFRKVKNISSKDSEKNSIIPLRDKVQAVYNHINLQTTCSGHCVCCNVACPQMNKSEFLIIIERLYNTEIKSKRVEILKNSIRHFFSSSLIKPCPLIVDNKCITYEDRPLSCFLPDTWVFTKKGPKYIKDIMAGDEVIGIDGKLHKVKITRSKIYDGEIYNVKPQGHHLDCWCTNDHLWYVSNHKDKRKKTNPIWKESSSLVAKKNHCYGDYLSIPKNFSDINGISSINCEDYIRGNSKEVEGRILPYTSGKLFDGKMYRSVPKTINVDKDFLFMIGLYLAEGCSTSQSSSFTMHKKEKEYLDRIKNYLSSLSIECHYVENKNTLILRVDSCLFADLMVSLCGKLAENKAVNDDFFEKLSGSQLMEIYYAWNIGDGKKFIDKQEFSTVSISIKLILQMYFILLRRGIIPRLYSSKRSDRERPSYDLHVFPSNFRSVKPGQGTKNIVDDLFVYSPLSEIEKKKYCGPVYDLDVEDVESFVTSSGIVHNCRMYGLWPKEVYEERVQKFMKVTGLKKEEIPLNTQCEYVRRVDSSVPLTKEVIDDLYKALNDIDIVTDKLSQEQVDKKYNQRTWHDWFMVTVFGEERLSELSNFYLAAESQEIVDDFVEQMCIQVDKVGESLFGEGDSE